MEECPCVTTNTHRQTATSSDVGGNQEWVRIPAACAVSSLSRSTLYANFDIAGGGIKTASIRKRGATRGIRMVNVPSLLAFIGSFAEQSNTEKKGVL